MNNAIGNDAMVVIGTAETGPDSVRHFQAGKMIITPACKIDHRPFAVSIDDRFLIFMVSYSNERVFLSGTCKIGNYFEVRAFP
jgi:hypothetical protein